MTEVTIQLPDELIERLRLKAEHEQVSADIIIRSALAVYLDDDEPTDADILNSIEQSLLDVKEGRVRSYEELMTYLKEEFGFDADKD